MRRLSMRLAVLALVAGGWALSSPSVAAEEQARFNASFHGRFSITFAGCANGDNLLRFSGPGFATRAGESVVSGVSCLRQDALRPNCSIIVTDDTRITAAKGDVINFVNQGEDCLSPTGEISGTATYTITGGTGRFEDATGNGTVSVRAKVTSVTAGGVSGTFDPLNFAGTIASDD